MTLRGASTKLSGDRKFLELFWFSSWIYLMRLWENVRPGLGFLGFGQDSVYAKSLDSHVTYAGTPEYGFKLHCIFEQFLFLIWLYRFYQPWWCTHAMYQLQFIHSMSTLPWLMVTMIPIYRCNYIIKSSPLTKLNLGKPVQLVCLLFVHNIITVKNNEQTSWTGFPSFTWLMTMI